VTEHEHVEGPIVGYRFWYAQPAVFPGSHVNWSEFRKKQPLRLYPGIHPGPWRVGDNEAECHRWPGQVSQSPGHVDVPDEGCTCGLHAWLSMEVIDVVRWANLKDRVMPAPPSVDFVGGASVHWGKVRVGDKGLRSSHARPVALLYAGKTSLELAEMYRLAVAQSPKELRRWRCVMAGSCGRDLAGDRSGPGAVGIRLLRRRVWLAVEVGEGAEHPDDGRDQLADHAA
jgi:hypothetical protein